MRRIYRACCIRMTARRLVVFLRNADALLLLLALIRTIHAVIRPAFARAASGLDLWPLLGVPAGFVRLVGLIAAHFGQSDGHLVEINHRRSIGIGGGVIVRGDSEKEMQREARGQAGEAALT